MNKNEKCHKRNIKQIQTNLISINFPNGDLYVS